MNQLALSFNLENPFKEGTQNWRIVKRLLEGPATNREFSRDMKIAKYTGRLSEVREKIRPLGFDIEPERIAGTLYRYELTRSAHP